MTRNIPGTDSSTIEKIAGEICRAVRGVAVRCVYRLDSGLMCHSYAFVAGSDHVGRPRICVHTVAVNNKDVDSIPFFNMFSLPDEAFLPEGFDFSSDRDFEAHIIDSIKIEDSNDAEKILSSASENRLTMDTESLAIINTLLEKPQKDVVLVGLRNAFERIRYISNVLPRPVRLSMSFILPSMLAYRHIFPGRAVVSTCLLYTSPSPRD